MATDLRYPASVSENIVRALRKVADELLREHFDPDEADGPIADAFRALADELEAGKPSEDESDYISPRGEVRKASARIVSRRKGTPMKLEAGKEDGEAE